MAEKRDPRAEQARAVLEQVKTAVKAGDWRAASRGVDQLRFGYGWRYSDMAREFGGSDVWEPIAAELDAHDGDDPGDDESEDS